MNTKSKVAFVLVLLMLGLASPAFAQSSRCAFKAGQPTESRRVAQMQADSPAFTGGGSAGYNASMSTDA